MTEITVEQIESGEWQANCPVCGWKSTQPTHTKTRHRCKVTGEVITYVPVDWETREKPTEPRKKMRVKPPGLMRQGVNYAQAAVKHELAGRPECTDEQVAERFAICQSNRCGFFIDKGEGLGQCAHQSCGCSLKRLSVKGEKSKLRWADQECPSINPETNKPWWGKILVNETESNQVELRNNDGAGENRQPPPPNNLFTRGYRFLRSLAVHRWGR